MYDCESLFITDQSGKEVTSGEGEIHYIDATGEQHIVQVTHSSQSRHTIKQSFSTFTLYFQGNFKDKR